MIDQWVRVRKWILPALVDTTEAEVIADLMAGRSTLWPGELCAFVTQLLETDSGRLMHIHLAGGDGREMMAMVPGMAAWGRMQGAQFATVNGRKGWKRRLNQFGFVPYQGELWKAL